MAKVNAQGVGDDELAQRTLNSVSEARPNMALLRRYVEKHGITCPGGKIINREAVRAG